jgi:Sulfotransferase domain
MPLKVVGAGLGRTGTTSLKLALERLIGGRCCHMFEVFERPASVPLWHAAARGESVDWATLMDDYEASVDWPAAAFWPELSAANPDAVVLLSTRASPQQWWASMERTIVGVLSAEVPADNESLRAHRAMVLEVFVRRFTPDWRDPAAAIAAYERHNERVRRDAPSERLLEWQPGDGWEPICERLGVPAPAQDFPNVNSTAEFRASLQADLEG